MLTFLFGVAVGIGVHRNLGHWRFHILENGYFTFRLEDTRVTDEREDV